MAGLIYLLMGGDLVIRGAVALARRAHVSPAVVALSVVAFGTSLPEMTVAVQATLTRHPGIVLGNVVGSNIANVLLIGGIAATVHPMSCDDRDVRRNASIMMVASVAFAGLCVWGAIYRVAGGLLLAGFGLTLALAARTTLEGYMERDPSTPLDWVLGIPSKLPMTVAFIAVGLLMLPLGADFLVDSAAEVASRFGVSDTVIGLTVVAVGTSLPEFTTTVLAAVQRRSDVAMGTIIGSNTFNVLAIMGVTGVLADAPVEVSGRFLALDLPIMLVTSAVVMTNAYTGRAIGRRTGVGLAAGYAVYLVAVIVLS